jgi:hypothetical protein
VAPYGRTVPGGFGPKADLDSYWGDWNPRYARGGANQKYDTPPPRFESFLVKELLPFVEQKLPAIRGRDGRALAGTSLGGYGSYKNGLQHPDLWTSMGSVSGAHNFLFAPGVDPGTTSSPVGVASPTPLPHQTLPSGSAAVPAGVAPSQADTFLVATLALGDPVADQAYFRGNTPRDLAMNGRAFAGATQSLFVKGFVNDTVARRPEDATDPVSVLFEDIVLPMNLDMDAAFTDEGVAREFDIHPGLHSEPYRAVWMREQLEAQYARVRHADGGGTPPPLPTTFDFRSVSSAFDIWGWHVSVAREATEFLTLRNVTCEHVTLQGSGMVTLTPPGRCQSVLHGRRSVTVDLGPSAPVDDPANAGATPVYGRTVTVDLTS